MTEVLRPGDVVAERYRIVRPIGQGGMGVVYEGEQLATGRKVAVKALVDGDPGSSERFEREARSMAKLADPRIAAVIDFVREPGVPPLLVMELLEGVSLATLLRRTGPLAIDRAVRITIQILEGLAAAHAIAIVHRDVKPSNIFLVTDGLGRESVKLLDFGVAKVLDATTGETTTTGAVVGTPSYLAPEQVRGERVDARADLHAVGVCLFEMLAARRPWRSQGAELVAEILRDRPLRFRDVGVEVPPAIAAVVERALEPMRDARFADAYEMIDALRRALPRDVAAVRLPASRSSTPRPSGRATQLLSIAAFVVGVAVVVAVLARFRAHEHAAQTMRPAPTTETAPPPPPTFADPPPAPMPSSESPNAPSSAPSSHVRHAGLTRGEVAARADGPILLEGENEVSGQDCFCYPLEVAKDPGLPPLRCNACSRKLLEGSSPWCNGTDEAGRIRKGKWLCRLWLGPRVKKAGSDGTDQLY